jgi:hypothetical protein
VEALTAAIVTALIALSAAVVAFVVLRRNAQLREARDLQRRIKALDRERRREIARAIRGGRAVRDPRDAALAADLAAHSAHAARRLSRLRLWLFEAVVSSLIVAAALWTGHAWVLVLLVHVLLPLASLVLARRAATQAARAAETNRALAAQFDSRSAHELEERRFAAPIAR